MAAANTSVKWMHSGMAGAPVVSNNWGDLTAMLDACLVTGFNIRPVQGISHDAATGLATVQCTGHGYLPDTVVALSGAAQDVYNTQARVLAAPNTDSFTVRLGSTPAAAATPASGQTLQARMAPLGFEIAFTGANKRAYRSTDLQSARNMLLVNNAIKEPGYNTTWAKWANVGIVQDMTDIDTIVGAQAPFDASNPLKNWKQVVSGQWGWHKWYHGRGTGYDTSGDAGAGSRNWLLVGDGRLFYLFVASVTPSNYQGRNFYCFGDIHSFKPGDNYATVLCADDNFSSSNGIYSNYPGQCNGNGLVSSLDVEGKVLLRGHTQIGQPVRWGVTSLNTSNGKQISGRGSMPFPNGADYSLWLLPAYVQQEDRNMRGMLPGMYWMPQDRPYSDMVMVDNVIGQEGRKFLLVRAQYSNEEQGAQVAFDLTGPWR